MNLRRALEQAGSELTVFVGALGSSVRRNEPMKVAAVLAWIAGFGFGLPCIYAIWYFADHGQVWTFLGFPTYGDGPFADNGIRTTIPLLVAFLLVCAAEVVLGWLLWHGRRHGFGLSWVLLPAELAFWIGFDLPLGPPLGLARTASIVIARRRSRGGFPS